MNPERVMLPHGDCPECEAKGIVVRVVGALPVCLACDWTGWGEVSAECAS